MDNKIVALSKYRLQKAQEDLYSSEILFNIERFSQSLNRSYYAMFHATRALLAYDKFDSKSHSGILAFFNQHYIKTGKIDIKFFAMLTLAQKLRTNSDYDDFYIASKEEAGLQLKNAQEFIEEKKNYISSINPSAN